jgi:hypothetical protein
MMGKMRRFAPAAGFLLAALSPLVSWADDQPIVDGRLQAYRSSVTLPPSGTALLWLLMLALSLVVLLGLFKNAGRTHLD